jgi:perosamine synthetase
LDTFQICPVSVEQKITAKTKAIITVGLYGLSPDMDPIMDLALNYGLQVIEDNAECFLGEYKGRLAGTLGHCASFSFQSSKHLTSGEGGVILTDDVDLAEGIRRVQSLGYAGVGATTAKISKADIQNPDYSRHVSMGWNYRMPELCCAVALAQVENIDNLVDVRIKSAQIFEDATREFHDWFRPQYVGPDYKNSYWTWVCKNMHDTASWLDIRDAFVSSGGDGVYGAWKLTYLEPMFANMNLSGRQDFIDKKNIDMYRVGLCPNAEYLQGRLFQFKTNYWNLDDAKRQAGILHSTLKAFN